MRKETKTKHKNNVVLKENEKKDVKLDMISVT